MPCILAFGRRNIQGKPCIGAVHYIERIGSGMKSKRFSRAHPFKSTRIYSAREFYSKKMSLFGPDRPKYLLSSSNLSTFDHRQHIKSRAWGLSDLSSPLGLALQPFASLWCARVYPAWLSRLRRGSVTPLEIWSKAFQIPSVLSDWAGSALRGAESSRTTVRPGSSMQRRKNHDGNPESLGPYLISWSNMIVPIPVSSV